LIPAGRLLYNQIEERPLEAAMTGSKTTGPAGTTLVVLSVLLLLAVVLPPALFMLLLLAYLVLVFHGEGVVVLVPAGIVSTGKEPDPARGPPC